MQVVVASGTLDATLEELAESKSERCLVACDASRTDLLLGLSTAHSSTAGPHIAAVLMTGAKQANPWVKRILEVRKGARIRVPPLSAVTGIKISAIQPSIGHVVSTFEEACMVYTFILITFDEYDFFFSTPPGCVSRA